MKEFTITSLVKEYSYEELPEADRRLVDAAKEAVINAYVPYSKFHVGAAILLDNSRIVTGSNQENAAYPSGLCAERTAAFYASSQHPAVPFKKIAIAAWTNPDNKAGSFEEFFQDMPISPCGGCRQALMEYEHLYGSIEVILYGRKKIYVLPSVSSLLPFSFTSF